MNLTDSNPGTFRSIREVVFEGYLPSSQMSDAERCTMIMLLDKLRPECAIEVGTAGGGSLSMIARYATKVYSLDINPTCRERFHSRFPNAEFVVGDSRKTLPVLLRILQASNEKLAFVLIDGLHTSEGVKADIENVLAYKPTCPLYVAMHDSFNPACRSGMAAADWASSEFVHYVELDFVGGQFNRIELNGAREMWCGLALALMLPERRQGELIVSEDERPMFDAVLGLSAHPSQRMGWRKAMRRRLRDFDERHLGRSLRRVAASIR